MSTAHGGFPKIRGKFKRVYMSYRDYIGISKGFLGFPTIRVTSLGSAYSGVKYKWVHIGVPLFWELNKGMFDFLSVIGLQRLDFTFLTFEGAF